MVKNTKKKTRVAVGLSGGVDSSVAAQLMLDQGYEVLGIFLKIWDDHDPFCPAAKDAMDARMTAEKLKIPFYVFDFSKEYKEQVFSYFLSENKKGRTPNADILCNVFIKFGKFLEKAEELGADFIVTGHYAKKVWNEKTKLFELHIPEDKNKDQTYFLYRLTQDQLAHAIFPLENMNKKSVREMAKKLKLPTAEKKDSVGICMVGDRDYRVFLEKFLNKDPGKMVDADSKKVVGEHRGLSFYTIGQRHDLQIGGIRGFREAPWFVISKNFKKNELMVSQDEGKLQGTKLTATNLHWIAGFPLSSKFNCQARIRYRSEKVPCTVTMNHDDQKSLKVIFDTPVRAITPGQSIVFYDKDVCLGGGEIE